MYFSIFFSDECDMCFPLPTILNHQISTGQTLYSIMYQPPNMDVRRKYPVVLNIYGGPDFQLVTNTFKVIFTTLKIQKLKFETTDI